MFASLLLVIRSGRSRNVGRFPVFITRFVSVLFPGDHHAPGYRYAVWQIEFVKVLIDVSIHLTGLSQREGPGA